LGQVENEEGALKSGERKFLEGVILDGS
jgi:hypothetical protein